MDFSSYLDLQRQHLLDLGSTSELNNGTAQSYISTISSKLDNVKSSYDDAKVTTRDVVTHQKDIMSMINNETDRLSQKKTNIDHALQGQKRMIALNDSYRMRYRYYLYMVITVLVVTVLYVVIRFTSKVFTFIPGAVYDLLLIIIFVTGIYIIYTTYLDMSRRDTMNFNNLSFARPRKQDSRANSSITNISEGDKTKTVTDSVVCKGQECCGGGADIIWDDQANACVPNDAFNVQNNNNLVKPNDPSEYVNYGKY
jgi:hypothetical protein